MQLRSLECSIFFREILYLEKLSDFMIGNLKKNFDLKKLMMMMNQMLVVYITVFL